MHPAELQKTVARGRLSPLYYFHGDNTHLLEQSLKGIIERLFESRDPDLDLQYFDAQTHDPGQIVQCVQTAPFLSKKKLVVVRRAEVFRAAQWKLFEGCFRKPPPFSCLIITGEKFSLKGGPEQAFKVSGVQVAFNNPRGKTQIQDTVRAELQRRGRRMTPEAVRYFADHSGRDGRMIFSELEKICLYCTGKNTIDVEDLKQVLSGGHTTTIFTLVEEVAKSRHGRTLVLLHDLIGDGLPPLVILKMIMRQFRLLGLAQQGVQQGKSTVQIGRKLGLRYDRQVESIIQQARMWQAASIVQALHEIFNAQLLMRSSRAGSTVILENLVCRLGGLRRQPPA